MIDRLVRGLFFAWIVACGLFVLPVPASAETSKVPPSQSTTKAPTQEGIRLRIEQLHLERRRLGLGGSILTLTLGGTALLIGLPVLIYGLATLGISANTITLLAVGASLTLPGLIAMIVGIVWFARSVARRRLIDKEIKSLKAQQPVLPNQASLDSPLAFGSPSFLPAFSLRF